MKKQINKNLIFNLCLSNQNELIENIEKRVNGLNTDVYSNNHSASQSEDRKAGKVDLINALQEELAFAIKEMEYLKSLDPAIENTNVSPGAVLITDKLIFFISISNVEIEIENNEIKCISTKAPIYTSMKGLKKGETFKYNQTNYEIKDIY